MIPDQVELQRAVYDDHYPKMAAAVREQLAHPVMRSFYDRLAAIVLDALPAAPDGHRHRLFEAGCGEGLVASAVQRVAAARGLDVAYTGTDLSAAAIELARTAIPGEYVVGDALEVVSGLGSGSQDLLWAKNLLHHLPDPAAFLRQAMRVVGPEGRVVVVEPRMWCPVHWIHLVFFRRERFLWSGYRRNSAAFDQAGCRILDTTPFGWLPYEILLATRFSAPRRLLSVPPGPRLARISALDDGLTSRLPDLALYMVTVVAGE